MSVTFTSATLDHRCTVPNMTDDNKNVSIPVEMVDGEIQYSSCLMYDIRDNLSTSTDLRSLNSSALNRPTVSCRHGWTYDYSVFKSSIVSEFDLVCDRAPLKATVEAMFSVGYIIGCVLVAQPADRFGRKKIFLIAQFVKMVVVGLGALADNVTAYIFVKFFMSLCAVYEIGFVLAMELVGPNWRTFCGLMYGFSWVIGYMVSPLLAYFIRDWRQMHCVMALSCIPFFISILFVPESPRWLYCQNKTEEADKLMRTIAKYNGRKIDGEMWKIHVQEEASNSSPMVILTNTHLRKWTLNLCFNWMTVSLVYFGLSYYVEDMAGDVFFNTFLSALVEVPGMFLAWFILVRCGRRLLGVTELVSGLSLVVIPWVPAALMKNLGVALILVGRFAISASYAIIYVYAAEIFPTSVRATGIGLCNIFASIGGIASPFMGDLGKYAKFPALPMILFGVFAFVAGVLAFFLPETRGKPLPTTVEEAVQLNKPLNKLKEDQLMMTKL